MPVPVFSVNEVLTSSAMNQVGMWKVASGSFTNTTTINVDNVFTSSFLNYKIYIAMRPQTTQTGGVSFQLRAGGSTLAGANYNWQGVSQNVQNNPGPNALTNDVQFYLSNLYSATNYSSITEITLFAPQATAWTGYLANSFFDWAGPTYYYRTANGIYVQTTSVDGFKILPNVASSGIYRVYGMRD